MEVVGRLHLELVHGLAGAGNDQTVGIITVRHILVLLLNLVLISVVCFSVGSGIRA